jgi:aldose 1-epimerase
VDELKLSAGGVTATVDPAVGLDIIAPEPPGGGLGWGCYPMVPWAGRVRHGRFHFAGEEHHLPIDLAPPHAIHGLAHRTPWEVTGPASLAADLNGRWAFGGVARQNLALSPTSLRLTLSLTAGDVPTPYLLGYHPCFRRRLAAGEPVELDFAPESMWRRDAEGIPTGELVAPTPRPWDDCFSGVTAPPVLTWPGALRVELRATTETWVVFDEPDDIICIEPQTGAPDEFNRAAKVLEPGATASLDLTISWDQAVSP